MPHVLVNYDLPEDLHIKNPSGTFRRHGVRVAFSAWAFPEGHVPAEEVERLRTAGATVYVVRFHPEDQDKIVALAKEELRKHLGKVLEKAAGKSALYRRALTLSNLVLDGASSAGDEDCYRRWRSVLARARRELLAAESCALAFDVRGDVADALDALGKFLAGELDLALAWRQGHAGRKVPA